MQSTGIYVPRHSARTTNARSDYGFFFLFPQVDKGSQYGMHYYPVAAARTPYVREKARAQPI
jgi:hypothetical protein